MSLTPAMAAKRLGKLTASVAPIVMGGEKTDGLKKLVRRLAGERVFGDLGEDSYQSKYMQRGDELEERAIEWAEFELGMPLERQQHVDHPRIPYVAATPDGLRRRLLTAECKCPSFHVWADIREDWQTGKRGLACVPSEYRHQCKWQPWCCDIREGVFVAFHPKGGGIAIPYTITEDDCKAMEDAARRVEGLIRNWVEILKGTA